MMSFKEYCRRQKELSEKIRKENARADFSYCSMGVVNTSAEREEQRLIAKAHELESEAREYAEAHPEWVKE